MFSNRNWPSFSVVFKGEKFESFASVILRVPGLMLIDQWSHSSERSWPQTSDITDKCYAFIFNLSNCHYLSKFLFFQPLYHLCFRFLNFPTVLIQGLVILILPLPKLVTLYMHYLSVAALTGASLLSRHYVLTEFQEGDEDSTSYKSGATSASQPVTQLPSVINFSPQYALKFAREFR